MAMGKIHMIRYHHVKWDADEYEYMTFLDYAEARKAYDKLASEDYYSVVRLYNCVEVIGRP